MSESTLSPDDLEETLLKVAEKDTAAIESLTVMAGCYRAKDMPSEIKSLLTDNLNIIIDDVAHSSENPILRELILELAAAGFDSMLMRDALASASRHVHADFPDPAGLIQALGIFDVGVNIRNVRRRWDVFSILTENSIVWHSSYGIGRISEIDSFSDLVYIRFRNRERFNVVQAMMTLSIAKQDSFATALISDEKSSFNAKQSLEEFDRRLAQSFVPPLDNPAGAAEAILVPDRTNLKTFLAWRSGGEADGVTKKTLQKREWNEARALEELKTCLKDAGAIVASERDAEAMLKIFSFEATKPLSRFVFSECLATLWSMCSDRAWIEAMMKGLPKDTLAWSDEGTFIELTCKLPARLVPHWLYASAVAQGNDWLLNTITTLPLRFWPMAEKILPELELTTNDLFTVVHEKLRRKNGSADAAVWIWQQQTEESLAVFSNSSIVFKILTFPVKGEFIKARKQLLKLLMENQDFQRALMGDGSDKGIDKFVKIIKSSMALSQGEQQSLLVKIVRIYPGAAEIVADRKKVVARRPLPKLTSFPSYEERRLELEEIANQKIPKNSAAIAHARSYGDLRENAEYKAAKDEQRYLMARRGELENGLKEVMVTDFSDVRVLDAVVPGCTVELLIGGTDTEKYSILGLWDSAPEQNILSYETPLGKALIGKKVGDIFTTPQNKTAEVKNISKLSSEIQKSLEIPEE